MWRLREADWLAQVHTALTGAWIWLAGPEPALFSHSHRTASRGRAEWRSTGLSFLPDVGKAWAGMGSGLE